MATFFFCKKLVSVNAYLLLVLSLLLELDLAVNQCKQSVVLTDTNVVTGVDRGASLSYDDVACNYCLSVSLLYAKALRLTITAVLGRTNTLFMSKKL